MWYSKMEKAHDFFETIDYYTIIFRGETFKDIRRLESEDNFTSLEIQDFLAMQVKPPI